MDYKEIISGLSSKDGLTLKDIRENFSDEVYLEASPEDFKKTCLYFHKKLSSPVAALFAVDERRDSGAYRVYCAFKSAQFKKWFFVHVLINADNPVFDCLSCDMYSAVLFEREINEMFGLKPGGAMDLRGLHLHEEVWPQGHFPLRKDFCPPAAGVPLDGVYRFTEVKGEGIFELPVGPVHAGIIGPGHFRFSAAGEPIINLEIRLGFAHRGVEKLFEGKGREAVRLSERVSGDAAFAHGLSFCMALEKIYKINVPPRAQYLRAIYLEFERLYNHASGIGGIALDAGFSFPQANAAVIKESLQRINFVLTGSRFLKGINTVGGVLKDINEEEKNIALAFLGQVTKDFRGLGSMLYASVSFMDRVDGTGILKRRTAEDLGITGLAARACGIKQDLRSDFYPFYEKLGFKTAQESGGDALARLKVRFFESEESLRLIKHLLINMPSGEIAEKEMILGQGHSLGYVEGWRGPVLYWVKTAQDGAIDRCKIVDASFLNWQGLAYSVLGDIIPDFPLCNKSFDLSYAGTDL